MIDLFQESEQGDYGRFSGGMGPVSTGEGRFANGGWIDDPLPLSAKEGKGEWAQAPAMDGEQMNEKINVPEGGNGVAYGLEERNFVLDTVEGWDERHMSHRIG